MMFTRFELGSLTLPNRVVMPPMTRARAERGGLPTALMVEYYAQRASAGLMISEGTQISQQGQGYAWTPGIHDAAQVAAWRQVTGAVHAAGGRFFCHLWHVGRISHTSLQPKGAAPVSSSALLAPGVKVFIDPSGGGPAAGAGDMVQHSLPRALEAGFDGVEIHAANGYLINQFIDSRANLRTDRYGGALDNRLRFLREVTAAVIAEAGAGRVGVRLAPLRTLQGAVDDTPEATYLAAARELDRLGVAYIHIAEADWDDAPPMAVAFKEALRIVYSGAMIYSGHYSGERARAALERGWADLIGFGRAFIANPDLPERLRNRRSLSDADPRHFFGGAAAGYTDYPVWPGLSCSQAP